MAMEIVAFHRALVLRRSTLSVAAGHRGILDLIAEVLWAVTAFGQRLRGPQGVRET
jgi:hypothetical protein